MVYEAIAESNLDPAECKLLVIDDKALITHDSGSTFEFRHIARTLRDPIYVFKVNAVAADSSFCRSATLNTIEDVVKIIREWADEVKLVADIPDYWAELQRSNQEFVVGAQWADNTPFTKDEQRRIVIELKAITEHVKERLDLNSEQTAQIEEWQDEVAEASTRLGRKDWKLLVYGTIVNLVVADVVTPGVARNIFAMLIQGIAHLVSGSEPPQILA